MSIMICWILLGGIIGILLFIGEIIQGFRSWISKYRAWRQKKENSNKNPEIIA